MVRGFVEVEVGSKNRSQVNKKDKARRRRRRRMRRTTRSLTDSCFASSSGLRFDPDFVSFIHSLHPAFRCQPALQYLSGLHGTSQCQRNIGAPMESGFMVCHSPFLRMLSASTPTEVRAVFDADSEIKRRGYSESTQSWNLVLARCHLKFRQCIFSRATCLRSSPYGSSAKHVG